ncbi:MAG TPA: hypothetical protein VEF76_05525 [Patescibacteria group bacterium]|nr:hypothetical protein [Patescibacteria group bacterium]
MISPAPANILVATPSDDLMLRLQIALRSISRPAALYHVAEEEKLFAFLRKAPGFETALRPDMILLDAPLLPALDRLKSGNPYSPIPVIVIADHMDHALARDCHARFANAALGIPKDTAGLRAIAGAIDAFWFRTARLPPNVDA